jgi:serine phosphatase RsbU (regulator of sigma subunit)
MLGEYAEANEYYAGAIKIHHDENDSYNLSRSYINLSWLYHLQADNRKAIPYIDSAYNLAKEMSYKELEHDALLQKADVQMALGQKDVAYKNLKKAYILWQDLHNEEATQNLNELRTKYQTESVENENLLLKKDSDIKDLRLERNNAEISNQRMIIIASAGGLVVLLVLVYFLNKWNKDKRKRNTLLSEQKQLVETKNREILDSIQYAKRIQAAILPPEKLIKEYLPQSFVFYQPKDVVAGDFYWVEQKEGVTLFAAADCTGHGVPGAMVSVVCNNGLNRSVREYGLTEPGKILDQTRSIVLEEFEKSEDDVSDGMDIAMCAIKDDQLLYAGAHNPLWLVRDGELTEIKANKQPIGKFERAVDYTTHTLDLKLGDMIYLFTDGFADQFGGENGKKYKSANFKKFLISISSESIDKQLELVQSEFASWKDGHEQIDDVCVFGVRI